MTNHRYDGDKDARIDAAISNLETALGVLKSLKSGDIPSKKDAQNAMGISSLQMNNFLNDNFSNFIRKHASDELIFETLYDACDTPNNKLLRKVFRFGKHERPIFPKYDPSFFWDKWLPDILDEHELRAMTLLYKGEISDEDDDYAPVTMSKAAEITGFSPKRFKEITDSAYYKIGRPENFGVLFGMDERITGKYSYVPMVRKADCRS